MTVSSGIYFSVCLALMVISLLETVIITNVLHHSSMKYQEIPKWVKVIILKHIANMICYRWPKDVLPPHKRPEVKPESSNGSSGPWVIQPANQAHDRHVTSNGGERMFFFTTNKLDSSHIGCHLWRTLL